MLLDRTWSGRPIFQAAQARGSLEMCPLVTFLRKMDDSNGHLRNPHGISLGLCIPLLASPSLLAPFWRLLFHFIQRCPKTLPKMPWDLTWLTNHSFFPWKKGLWSLKKLIYWHFSFFSFWYHRLFLAYWVVSSVTMHALMHMTKGRYKRRSRRVSFPQFFCFFTYIFTSNWVKRILFPSPDFGMSFVDLLFSV